MLLLLDNFDSFTYNLLDYLLQMGIPCKVYRNDHDLNEVKKGKYRGIVLSPGPGRPSVAGIMPELIRHYHGQLPILGICLGHQALGEFYGATLTKALRPMHGKLSQIACRKDQVFENIPVSYKVVRYHSLLLTKLPPALEVLAETSEGEVMAFKHRVHPSYGLQFHPEAYLTEYGFEILKNWTRIVGISG